MHCRRRLRTIIRPKENTDFPTANRQTFKKTGRAMSIAGASAIFDNIQNLAKTTYSEHFRDIRRN